MDPRTRWSVITVTHNSREALMASWTPLACDASSASTVIDNASTDDSCRIAQNLGVNVTEPHQSVGSSSANGRGLRKPVDRCIAIVNRACSLTGAIS